VSDTTEVITGEGRLCLAVVIAFQALDDTPPGGPAAALATQEEPASLETSRGREPRKRDPRSEPGVGWSGKGDLKLDGG
jgi:hypothetical protein